MTPPRIQPRERIGALILLSPLGEGGESSVYAAERGGKPRAVKLLRASALPPQEVAALVRGTVEALNELNSALLPRYYEVGLHRDMAWVEMERLKGGAYGAAGRPLSLEEAVRVTAQAAELLQQAHLAGLLHLDVKPENLWRTEQGDLKLLDFETCAIGRRARRGTPAYMAPELWSGGEPGAGTLVYALSLTLAALLLGAYPLQDRPCTADAWRVLHWRGLADLVTAALAAQPAGVRDLVARGLRRDPAERAVDLGEWRQRALRLAVAAPVRISFGSPVSAPGAGAAPSDGDGQAARIPFAPPPDPPAAAAPSAESLFALGPVVQHQCITEDLLSRIPPFQSSRPLPPRGDP